ncbi:hypothetical protein acsn021_16720 [Anaerocolumna cellulosilytica]|uniref:Uncharacterized protein n=1 Tax=Anaerocolumna cellulosilytica TaxID=433286 RepID=A0A6S6QRY5_9FIRM|nr:hypothetical protein [Anaerocolumna cellulosilytica]MBB5194934.1 hypothetical protein [Anaerocolumna cellulosilytica]BCJ94103.1 hypothetical protein acsn021_16720 [Anaerocolumna cellulosilytica]
MTAAATGMVALGIGFIKKSVPSTILSAVLISSFFSNIMFNVVQSQNHFDLLPLVFMIIAVAAGTIVTLLLAQTITNKGCFCQIIFKKTDSKFLLSV